MTPSPETTRRRWAIGLLLLAAIAVGAWWVLQRPHQAASTPADVAAQSQDSPGASAIPADTRRATPLPPMPLTGVPLRDALPSLRERAHAGDGKAACRLAVELLRCQELEDISPEQERQIEEQLRSPREGIDPVLVETMANRLQLQRAIRETCDGLPADLDTQTGHYLRIAALAGEHEAMIRYAAGEGFNKRHSYAHIRTPQFDHWRREAPGLMERALVAGDPRAAFALYDAHRTDVGKLAGLIAEDPEKAFAYGTLLEELFGDTMTPWLGQLELPSLSAERSRQAAAQAATWHQDHFQGQRLDMLDVGLDSMLLPMDATADEVLATDVCASRQFRHHD